MSTEPTKVFSLFAFFFMFNFRRKKEALEQQRSRFLAPSKDPSFTSFEASAIKFPIPLGVVKAPRLPAFTVSQLSQPRAKSILCTFLRQEMPSWQPFFRHLRA